SFHKPLPVFLVLIALLLKTFSQSLLIGDYLINPARYLAECENLDRPSLRCNGKCQLAKKLEKEQQDNSHHKKESRFEWVWTSMISPWPGLDAFRREGNTYPRLVP